MKTYLYFFIPFLLFCCSIQGQNNAPPLIKKETVIYYINPDGSEELEAEVHDVYQYDNDGNLIIEEQFGFDDQGGFNGHLRYKNEYDVSGNKIKSIFQTYNVDVDLWITRNHYDFFYDDNNCLIGELRSENIISNQKKIEQTFINDNNCLKLEDDFKFYGQSGQLHQHYKSFFEYNNEQVSYIKRSYFSTDEPDIHETEMQEFTYNEYGDFLKRLLYKIYPDSTLKNQLYNSYAYDFYDNGLLKSKDGEGFSINYLSNQSTPDTLPYRFVQSAYEYDCQGNLIKEVAASQIYNPQAIINFTDKKYITYFYSGENDCFDHKENLELKIFPNPTSEFIKISSPIFGSGDTNVRITDLTGRVIFDQLVTSRVPEFSVDLKKINLPTGIFIVQLKSDKYQIGEKILFRN